MADRRRVVGDPRRFLSSWCFADTTQLCTPHHVMLDFLRLSPLYKAVQVDAALQFVSIDPFLSPHPSSRPLVVIFQRLVFVNKTLWQRCALPGICTTLQSRRLSGSG